MSDRVFGGSFYINGNYILQGNIDFNRTYIWYYIIHIMYNKARNAWHYNRIKSVYYKLYKIFANVHKEDTWNLFTMNMRMCEMKQLEISTTTKSFSYIYKKWWTRTIIYISYSCQIMKALCTMSSGYNEIAVWWELKTA